MNIVQSFFERLARPEPPLHVGEAMVLWTSMIALDETRALIESMVAHAFDQDLRNFLETYVTDLESPLRQRLEKLVREHGIPFPPVTRQKPNANREMIPPGVLLTDEEIANAMMAKCLGALELVHKGMLQSLRRDVGQWLYTSHQEVLKQALMLQQMMMDKGWLKVPPPYIPPGGPAADH